LGERGEGIEGWGREEGKEGESRKDMNKY